MHNVRDFGAIGNGIANDTAAVQKVLDAGGEVFLPDGVYRCGTLYLRSNGGLTLSDGAVIFGSNDPADYNDTHYCPQNWDSPAESVSGRHLISAVEVENVFIRGGVIDGNGLFWMRGKKPGRPIYLPNPERPAQMVFFCESRNVQISDCLMRNASYWHCFIHGCEKVSVDHLTVRGNPMIINCDGLDIDCCCDVHVANCDLQAGDDALTLRGACKRLKNPRPCEKVTVENCTLYSAYATGIRLGVGTGEIRNCRLSNLRILHAKNGINLVAKWSDYIGAGGVSIRDVEFSDIELNAMRPFWISLDNRYVPMREPSHDVFENILFNNMHCKGELTSYIEGNGFGTINNIVFRNMDLICGGCGKAPLINADGLWCVDSEDTVFSLKSVGKISFENSRISAGDCWACEVRKEDAPEVFSDNSAWRIFEKES